MNKYDIGAIISVVLVLSILGFILISVVLRYDYPHDKCGRLLLVSGENPYTYAHCIQYNPPQWWWEGDKI